VEARLIPTNALIGLVTRDGLNPPVPADAGLQLVGLEIPCVALDGVVVVDVVLANPDTGHLVACEAKSGSNVEVAQARRYQALDARTVVRSAFVTLRQRVDPRLEVIYAAMAENRERMLLSLSEACVQFPLITVSRKEIALDNAEAASRMLQDAFDAPLSLAAPPPAFIPFDHESSVKEVRPHVNAALVAALPERAPMISITSLTERAAPHYVLYANKAQGRLRTLVGRAAKEIAVSDPATFEYNPPKGNHDGFVKFLRNPEENDPRGRTQGYQRLARSGQRTVRRRPEARGQMSLLDELDKADISEESAAMEEEEGDGL